MPTESLAERVVEAHTSPQNEVVEEKVTTTSEVVEKPLEVAEYIKDLWKVGEASNHFNMPQLLSEINTFVLSEIERNKMTSNRDSYKEIIAGYEKRLHLPENLDVYTRVEKVAELIKIDAKLLQALKDKEDLLNGDPTQMSATQLKKYLNLNGMKNV